MSSMFAPMKINNLLEPTLKPLTSFKFTQKKEEKPHSSLIEEILLENELESITNTSKYSLYGALSMALFLTDSKADLVMKTVSEYLLTLFRMGKIPIRLYNFKDNRKLLTDFLNKPYHDDFQRVRYFEKFEMYCELTGN